MDLAKSVNNEVSIDGETMLLGKINRQAFNLNRYTNWYNEYYEAYGVDTILAAKVKEELKDVRIKLFLGTWCSDSQREVPAFCKVLDNLKFDHNQIEFIAIDRTKKLPTTDLVGFEIEYVPTIIFYKNNNELGRIIETPINGLEEDMLSILSN